MSSKHVPEIAQLPIEEQMEYLELWVLGHWELFERHRGRNILSGSVEELLTPNLTVSPTADMKAFNELLKDIRVIRKAIAVFHRDGCSAAASILHDALLCTDRWSQPVKLPFEDILPTQKEPMVLLMFNPRVTIPVMEWFRNGTFMELDALWSDNERMTHEPREETRRIAALLPSLHECWASTLGPDYPTDVEVFRAIAEDVLGPFGGMQDWFDARGDKVAALYVGSTCSAGMGHQHIFVHDAYDGVAFAYLLRGVHQEDVLSRIPRHLQKDVATWQFEVYEKTWFGIPQHKVMLIPERELSQWQGIYQSSLSMGAAAGYAAVYNPASVFQLLPSGVERDMGNTFVLDNR
jgi:hypothetical protein